MPKFTCGGYSKIQQGSYTNYLHFTLKAQFIHVYIVLLYGNTVIKMLMYATLTLNIPLSILFYVNHFNPVILHYFFTAQLYFHISFTLYFVSCYYITVHTFTCMIDGGRVLMLVSLCSLMRPSLRISISCLIMIIFCKLGFLFHHSS